MKLITIIIPVLNEEEYIEECIESILGFDYPKELLEIIFVDGISNDRTVDIIRKYQKDHDYIKILNNPKKIVPISMNIAIKNAKGDYICRLDAHAKYPINYISELFEWSQKLKADNVGAVCLTGVKSESNLVKAIQFVMSDKFGVGASLFRIGIKDVRESDTVPFGFYRRDVFDRIGLYDERLVRVQDLELNKRLKKNGGRIFLVPNITCVYYPRERLLSFFKNRFQTGRWVVLAAYLTNSIKSVSIRHLVPLSFTLLLTLSLSLSLVNKKYFLLTLLILFLYSTILFVRTLFIKKRTILSIYIVLIYFILHFSYGLGSLKAIFEIILKKLKGE